VRAAKGGGRGWGGGDPASGSVPTHAKGVALPAITPKLLCKSLHNSRKASSHVSSLLLLWLPSLLLTHDPLDAH
jgi:hypothetical protein